MNWQCYFDNETLDVGYKMYKGGALYSIIHGGNPFRIRAWIDETMERKKKCFVSVDIDENSQQIKNAECTCAVGRLTDKTCRHMAALMYGWEKMKTSEYWNDFFNGYRTGTKEEVLGIKYDIDLDFEEYEKEVARRVERGADAEIAAEYVFRDTICQDYLVDDPFRRIERRGCFVGVFEVYRYILEKIVKLRYCSEMNLSLAYTTVACKWMQCLEAGSYEEKVEVKKLLDEYVKLPKNDYRRICAKKVKRYLIEVYASEEYKMHRAIFEYLRIIPQGYVATVGSICDYIGRKLSKNEVRNALNYPDIENEHLRYKVVKADGNFSEYFAGMDNDRQREKLEKDGVEFLGNGRVNMEECLY